MPMVHLNRAVILLMDRCLDQGSMEATAALWLVRAKTVPLFVRK